MTSIAVSRPRRSARNVSASSSIDESDLSGNQLNSDIAIEKVVVVTPSLVAETPPLSDEPDEEAKATINPRRSLFAANQAEQTVAAPISRLTVVTPERNIKRKTRHVEDEEKLALGQKPMKRRLFGRMVVSTHCQANVKSVYSVVRKLTGAVGGNGYSGPIYGELTMASMQKMIDLMVKHAEFDSSSRFIDVGSGIGKPNLHVAQYPGVQFSCGVELEHVRWNLGMVCLKGMMDEASAQRSSNGLENLTPAETINGRTMFLHRNIMEAMSFDPFTHVYMFSIGFPPNLWKHLSKMWNSSESKYLICYLNPRDLIETYEFDVELVTRMSTSMHGSKEGHMGFIYRRVGTEKSTARKDKQTSPPCDPIFQKSWDLVQSGFEPLHAAVTKETDATMNSTRSTRSRGLRLTR